MVTVLPASSKTIEGVATVPLIVAVKAVPSVPAEKTASSPSV
jgi:hypothetical protein